MKTTLKGKNLQNTELYQTTFTVFIVVERCVDDVGVLPKLYQVLNYSEYCSFFIQCVAGPHEYHPITVALIKTDAKEITNLLKDSAGSIMSAVSGQEARERLGSVLELFSFALHSLIRNLNTAEKREFHETEIKRRMYNHEHVQPHIAALYSR